MARSQFRRPSNDEHDRIVDWRARTSPYTRRQPGAYARAAFEEYGDIRPHHGQSNRYRSTSNSVTASSPAQSLSSIPPSPRITLPPIMPRNEHQNHLATLPRASTFAKPPTGAPERRVNAQLPSLSLKRPRAVDSEDPDNDLDLDLGRHAPRPSNGFTAGGGAFFTHKSQGGLVDPQNLHGSAPPPPAAPQYPPVIPAGPPPRDKNAWKRYAQLLPGTSPQEFRCMWRSGDNIGHSTFHPGHQNPNLVCGYIGKRHLVKRHIETVHLKYK